MGSIVILTDFGEEEYPGIMEAVIRSYEFNGPVIHLSHNIRSQNVIQAAFILHNSLDYMPPGSVILSVIDPGVGSQRAIWLAKVRGRYILAPDNGLLTPLMDEFEDIQPLDYESLFDNISDTFHGRDVFAPSAALLATKGPEALSFRQIPLHPMSLEDYFPSIMRKRIKGKVVHIDHFGNCITNIRDTDLQRAPLKEIRAGGERYNHLSNFYAEGSLGEPLALVSSYGTLELAIRNGNYADVFAVEMGRPVEVLFNSS
jgi:S-adenosylmethionine hydrolase